MLILESLQPLMLARAATAAAAYGSGDGDDGDDDEAPMPPAGSSSLAAAWTAAMVESRHQLQAQQHLGGAHPPPGGGQLHSCVACQPAGGEASGLAPEALQAAWAEAATDICEALAAAAELVATCQQMGRLQVDAPCICHLCQADGCCVAVMDCMLCAQRWGRRRRLHAGAVLARATVL